MLGSTADSLFWMFRYIERVENTLCMIESGFQLYLLSSSNLYNECSLLDAHVFPNSQAKSINC